MEEIGEKAKPLMVDGGGRSNDGIHETRVGSEGDPP